MDLLCVFGRPIEQVHTSSGLVWRPSRYVERLTEDGKHSGVRVAHVRCDESDPRVVVAGGNANVLAAVRIFERFVDGGMRPEVVMFAAGRPAYIAHHPDPAFCEGAVFKERFTRAVRCNIWPTRILLQSKNKNTKDDLVGTLRYARRRGFRSVGIVSLGLHIPRITNFLRLVHQADPALRDILVHFFAAEKVLAKASSRYRAIFRATRSSPVHKRTAAWEAKGIRDLRAGRYKLDSTGYKFARTTC